MAEDTAKTQQKQRAKESFSQKLYAAAEAVPVYLGKGVNTALKVLLRGSRSERLIREIMPTVKMINDLGEMLEDDLRKDISARPIDELLAHLPIKLPLVLQDELLRDSPEEMRLRRCGDVEKSVVRGIGQSKTVPLIPGLTLELQAQWQLLLDDALRARLCEEMRDRLGKELQIALGEQVKDDITRDAARKLPADSAADVAAAAISRLEKALRAPVSELFFKPLTREFKERFQEDYQKNLESQGYNSLDRKNMPKLDLEVAEKKIRRRAEQDALDELLPEAFATARLASQLVVKTPGANPKPMRHFDVQLIGGIVLHQGKIAEMVTGEGKTLVATLPTYLNAITGRGVHIVTTNDYLAKRDASWMGPLYEFLGCTVGNISGDAEWPEKQAGYNADITYGTNDQFGFDYLRDNMKTSVGTQVQRPLHYAIVDEVDNILIDEARTPLIISGMPEESTDKYYKANTVAQRLRKSMSDGDGGDYKVAEKEHTVTLTEEGIIHAQQMLGVESFYSGENVDWPHHMNQALAAKELYKRDRDYVVTRNREVIIVDEFTGRLMPGRRWSEGLHQAAEAKEGLQIKQETQTLATITYQNFFRMYEKLAGMTGTALTEAEEFDRIYGLDVVPTPTNRPLRRVTFPDVIYATQAEKYDAIVSEITRVHATGRPVLVGTIAIETSELISRMLEKRGIKHEVLNAKFHEREAAIIALAGQPGAVTIATNMAGRGTDIVLGPGVVQCHKCIIRSAGDDAREADPNDKPADECRRVSDDANKTTSGVDNLPCGLHIVGTERHEARRIDNQLRGRSGRQGDPGSSRFFLSLDDDLMRIFMGEWVRGFLNRAGLGERQQIESAMVSRSIERAQRKVEQFNFEMRKNVLQYDEVMDQQRKVIYGMRQKVLDALVPVPIRRTLDDLASRFIADELRTGDDLHTVTHRTFEPLQDEVRKHGVSLTQEQWLSGNEQVLARIVKDGADPSKVRLGPDFVRGWIERSIGGLMDESLHPARWQLGRIIEWARNQGIELVEQQIVDDANKAVSELVTGRAADAARGGDLDDYLHDWAAAALIIDMPTLANGDAWDFSHVKHWGDKLGVPIPVAEWDPISRKRDKQEELVLQTMLAACRGMACDDAARRFTPAVLDMYTGSALFQSNATAVRIALWAQRRLDARVEPAEVQGAFSGVRANLIGRISAAMQDKLNAPGSKMAGELAWISVQDYLAEEFASNDRDLAGLAAAFQDYYGAKLSPFEMSKLSYPKLLDHLAAHLPEGVTRDVDAETIEGMVMEMIEKSVDRAIDQFMDEKLEPDAVFSTVGEWLKSMGYAIGRDEWNGLTLPELRHTLEVQARRSHASETKDEAIETFAGAAVTTFLDSPLFTGERGYASLAAWAEGQFCFSFSKTIEADLHKIADKRKADLRAVLLEEKREAYKAATDDVRQAAREMIAEATEVYVESASSAEDFDETRIADWAAKAFKVTLSRTALDEKFESGEGSVKEYVIDAAADGCAKRSIDKVAEDVVDAVVAMCTSVDFIENWDYERLDTYVKHSKLPIGFDVEAFRDDGRKAIIGFFVNLASGGYKERAKEEVVPKVVANAATVLIDCELSAAGRNYNALAAKMNQKFNFGVAPLRLSKMDRAELSDYPHEQVKDLFGQRQRYLGRLGFVRSISVLVLHTLDTRWKDHLLAMDHLKAGIGLRGYAGIDPKDAYKKEGFDMFAKMVNTAQESISDLALKVYFDTEDSQRMARRKTANERMVHDSAASFARGQQAAADSAGKDESKPAPIRAQKMPGRNDACPCGKKKPDGTPVKYKNCCMKK